MVSSDAPDNNLTPEQRRQCYRISYPLAERPRLILAGRTYPIIDLSEEGIRFQLGAGNFCVLADQATADLLDEGQDAVYLAGKLLLMGCRKIRFAPLDQALYTVIRQASAQRSGLLSVRLFDVLLDSPQFTADGIEISAMPLPVLDRLPPFAVRVSLRETENLELHGRIVRIQDHYIAIHLRDQIPFKTIVAEQLRLRRKYLGYS
jgi:hypothetical protein